MLSSQLRLGWCTSGIAYYRKNQDGLIRHYPVQRKSQITIDTSIDRHHLPPSNDMIEQQEPEDVRPIPLHFHVSHMAPIFSHTGENRRDVRPCRHHGNSLPAHPHSWAPSAH